MPVAGQRDPDQIRDVLTEWMARQMPIDLLTRDIDVFEEDHPDGGIQIIRLFREVAQEKNAAWALRVADKALEMIGD